VKAFEASLTSENCGWKSESKFWTKQNGIDGKKTDNRKEGRCAETCRQTERLNMNPLQATVKDNEARFPL
jgi:hypothetical protein